MIKKVKIEKKSPEAALGEDRPLRCVPPLRQADQVLRHRRLRLLRGRLDAAQLLTEPSAIEFVALAVTVLGSTSTLSKCSDE
jgi:hypothetical protein